MFLLKFLLLSNSIIKLRAKLNEFVYICLENNKTNVCLCVFFVCLYSVHVYISVCVCILLFVFHSHTYMYIYKHKYYTDIFSTFFYKKNCRLFFIFLAYVYVHTHIETNMCINKFLANKNK